MRRVTAAFAALALGAALCSVARAQDDPRAVPLFNAQHAIGDVLNTFKVKSKVVVIVVQGGARYAGKIKDVGSASVILTGLQGKEFYDAWIPFQAIVAMEERTRMR